MKRMKSIGRVEVPQEAFLAVLMVDEWRRKSCSSSTDPSAA